MGMILLTNGCSWTWGGGLCFSDEISAKTAIYVEEVKRYSTHAGNGYDIFKERHEATWPGQLGKIIKADKVYNLSMGCGSNERIYRTTLTWLLNQSPEVLKNTVAVIQITEGSRYEYYDPEQKNDYNENRNAWKMVKTGVVISGKTNPLVPAEEFEVAQAKYKLWSNLQNMYSILHVLQAIHSLLNEFNIKHYFWCFTNDIQKYPKNIKEYMNKTFPFIDKPWELEHRTFWKYQQISSSDGHPSLEGHKQIAEAIYDSIKFDINK